MGRITVYHGGYAAVKKSEIIKGKNINDFGPGFYCTHNREQAIRRAKRYDTPIVSKYTIHMDTELKILDFREMTDDWLEFIKNCRHDVPHDYDIVTGAMSDDQVYNLIADYMDGIITREQFWVLAKFKYPTHQINFCSDEALKCLKYVSSEDVLL